MKVSVLILAMGLSCTLLLNGCSEEFLKALLANAGKSAASSKKEASDSSSSGEKSSSKKESSSTNDDKSEKDTELSKVNDACKSVCSGQKKEASCVSFCLSNVKSCVGSGKSASECASIAQEKFANKPGTTKDAFTEIPNLLDSGGNR